MLFFDPSTHLSALFRCDDGTLTPDNAISRWGVAMEEATVKSGRVNPDEQQLKARLEEAGFVDVECFLLKQPVGPWAKAKYDPLDFSWDCFAPPWTAEMSFFEAAFKQCIQGYSRRRFSAR
jgi:hypothetical protein